MFVFIHVNYVDGFFFWNNFQYLYFFSEFIEIMDILLTGTWLQVEILTLKIL